MFQLIFGRRRFLVSGNTFTNPPVLHNAQATGKLIRKLSDFLNCSDAAVAARQIRNKLARMPNLVFVRDQVNSPPHFLTGQSRRMRVRMNRNRVLFIARIYIQFIQMTVRRHRKWKRALFVSSLSCSLSSREVCQDKNLRCFCVCGKPVSARPVLLLALFRTMQPHT